MSNKYGSDFYDYSKIDYKGNKKKVCIVCPIHGESFNKPNKILSYRPEEGYKMCKECAKLHKASAWTKNKFTELCKGRDAIFYLLKMNIDEEYFLKVGITSRTVEDRYNRKDSPYNYEILKEIKERQGLFGA